MKQNYNIIYLSGHKHVTDEVYQQIIKEDYGVEIPMDSLHTPRINDYYLQLKEDNLQFFQKKLAENGLLNEVNNGKEL